MSNKSKYLFCPACDKPIYVPGNVRLHQKLVCKECNTDLEIIDLNPLTLDWAFDYEDTISDPHSDYEEDDYYYGNGDGRRD